MSTVADTLKVLTFAMDHDVHNEACGCTFLQPPSYVIPSIPRIEGGVDTSMLHEKRMRIDPPPAVGRTGFVIHPHNITEPCVPGCPCPYV